MLAQAVVIPPLQCSGIADSVMEILFLTVPTTIIVALSITSFVVHYSLIRKLNWRTMQSIRSELNKLEICVQMILILRLFVDFTFKKVFDDGTTTEWILYLFIYLFLSEFLPFVLLSLAISRQLRAYDRAVQT